ncbi:hypothetical protein AN958_11923 [Leucoagaricus sp. SymC.cos]|nr:hypothetical protein AN958_11923 [Leucoagaricus sp. SymC.cos]
MTKGRNVVQPTRIRMMVGLLATLRLQRIVSCPVLFILRHRRQTKQQNFACEASRRHCLDLEYDYDTRGQGSRGFTAYMYEGLSRLRPLILLILSISTLFPSLLNSPLLTGASPPNRINMLPDYHTGTASFCPTNCKMHTFIDLGFSPVGA